MKRHTSFHIPPSIGRLLLVALLLGSASLSLSAQSFGGGLSFFVPESLVTGPMSGSISKEAGLSTSLGIGDFLSIPVGFTYIKASGLMPYKQEGGVLERVDKEIWYTADTFIPYLRLKAHIPAGPVFVEGFAGIAGAWFIAPQMNEGAVGTGFADRDGGAYDIYTFKHLSMDISFGYGYQAGGSIGVQIDAIRVQVTSVFTDIIADTKATADNYYKVDYSAGTVDKDSDFKKKFVSRLRGVSIGIGGSYRM